jgi:hypothetical protein
MATKKENKPTRTEGSKKNKAPGAERSTVVDYRKLATILASQKPLGNYPLKVAQLLELANLPWPGTPALVGPEARSILLVATTSKAKRQTVEQSLVFLTEDLSRLASFAPVLRHLIKRVVTANTWCCTRAQMLEKGLPEKIQEDLKKQLDERVKAGLLPPGIGALKTGRSFSFFLFDQVIGAPASAAAPAASRAPAAKPAEEAATAAHSSAASIPSRVVGRTELGQRLERAFDELDARSGRHNQVLLYDLRRAAQVSREEFDACLDDLRRDGVFTLSCEEGRFGRLAHDAVEAGIEGPSGRLVYAARR